VNFTQVLQELAEQKTALVTKRRNDFSVQLDPNLGTGQLDWSLVRKILVHIIDNAAKFTEGGSITLSAQRLGPNLQIQVSDTGAGIPEEDVPHLFNAFRVAGDETSSKYGGAGIGLALSGRICDLIGGTIRVQSVLTRGSVFTISLPVEVISDEENNAAAA